MFGQNRPMECRWFARGFIIDNHPAGILVFDCVGKPVTSRAHVPVRILLLLFATIATFYSNTQHHEPNRSNSPPPRPPIHSVLCVAVSKTLFKDFHHHISSTNQNLPWSHQPKRAIKSRHPISASIGHKLNGPLKWLTH